MQKFDVIVVGAGHAGVEACLAACRKGMSTLVITTNLDRIGYMSCNPSIGGLAKGHMVREIDALGGEMGRAADETCIQFKRLNSTKGPAVRGSRAQCDKDLYSSYMREILYRQKNLTVLAGEVKSLLIEANCCQGVVTDQGVSIEAQAVIITAGTFLNGVMHIGLKKISGGRVGDRATTELSDQLKSLGFTVTRLKTGTPPRLHKDSIDWSKTIPQSGDPKFYPFSYRSKGTLSLPQIDCYLSYTSERTHEIIRNNLDKSPMFMGVIEGIGPRYCPSIEDKITRFADKEKHQTFLEPEGLNTESVYLQGISTSLPEDVQYEFIRTIAGLENVKMIRPGYAVEYDFFEPSQISHSLETRQVEGLYFAGQINGTSGYEEAAAQGLVAGSNAANKILEKDPLIFGRDQAYIGVLIDDLVTKGTKEPYRMMTSRAEHRLVLREDNTIDRLSGIAKAQCLVAAEDCARVEEIQMRRQELKHQLREIQIVPNTETQKKLIEINTTVLQKPMRLEEILRRDEISCFELRRFGLDYIDDDWVVEPVEIEIKYEGYIKRQNELIDQANRLEKLELPTDIFYGEIRGLSREEVEKLSKIMPRTLGQAGRISGVNPSAIQAIVVHLKGRQRPRRESSIERDKNSRTRI